MKKRTATYVNYFICILLGGATSELGLKMTEKPLTVILILGFYSIASSTLINIHYDRKERYDKLKGEMTLNKEKGCKEN